MSDRPHAGGMTAASADLFWSGDFIRVNAPSARWTDNQKRKGERRRPWWDTEAQDREIEFG